MVAVVVHVVVVVFDVVAVVAALSLHAVGIIFAQPTRAVVVSSSRRHAIVVPLSRHLRAIGHCHVPFYLLPQRFFMLNNLYRLCTPATPSAFRDNTVAGTKPPHHHALSLGPHTPPRCWASAH
ncbi:hypothetical protein EDB86DRAFT_3079288 [Lactarius hatsudake]|nr:hypothetical protein EDB86DRAFT_3079288 [Lactarius hatsudake]